MLPGPPPLPPLGLPPVIIELPPPLPKGGVDHHCHHYLNKDGILPGYYHVHFRDQPFTGTGCEL